MNRGYGAAIDVSDAAAVYVHINRLWEKIEDDPSLSDADLDRVAGWIKGADFTVNLVRH